MKKIILTIMLLAIFISVNSQEDSINTMRQYTSWSILAGPNISGYRSDLQNIDNIPDRIQPSLGADLGAAISYHIAPRWQLRLQTMASLERSRFYKNEQRSIITVCGVDLALQVGYTIDIKDAQLHILTGPYTHFILSSRSSNHLISDPFSRTVADNPRTDNYLFAMGESGAGCAMTLVMQFKNKWLLALDTRLGISDLLNAETSRLYIKPYRIALQIGRVL